MNFLCEARLALPFLGLDFRLVEQANLIRAPRSASPVPIKLLLKVVDLCLQGFVGVVDDRIAVGLKGIVFARREEFTSRLGEDRFHPTRKERRLHCLLRRWTPILDKHYRRIPEQVALSNLDAETVRSFGAEWSRFDQADIDVEELGAIFEQYFRIFPWEGLPRGARGFDAGCGSGRWARFVAPRVDELHLVDASEEALGVAAEVMTEHKNVQLHHASVDALPFEPNSMDFGYSLGVLHHVPHPRRH